jgi:hypothetical protein
MEAEWDLMRRILAILNQQKKRSEKNLLKVIDDSMFQ